MDFSIQMLLVCCLVTKSCLTLCFVVDYSPILDWVAISFSRGSSWSGIKPASPSLWGGFFTDWVTRDTHMCMCICVCVCFELNLRSLYMIKSFKEGVKVFQIIVTNYIGWQNSDDRKRSPDLKKKKIGKYELCELQYILHSPRGKLLPNSDWNWRK